MHRLSQVSMFTATNSSREEAANLRLVQDEMKLYHLHQHLLNLDDVCCDEDDHLTKCMQDYLKVLEKALVLTTKTKAIELGESALRAGHLKIKELISTAEFIDLIQSAYATFNENEVSFNYIAAKSEIDNLLRAESRNVHLSNFPNSVKGLAACGAFTILRKILANFSENDLDDISDDLDVIFKYAIHFGDEDMLTHLIKLGVGKTRVFDEDDTELMPLAIVLEKLRDSFEMMEGQIQLAKDGNHSYGTAEEIEAVFDARLVSYENMLDALLANKADPDRVPENVCLHAGTPRAIAASYLKNYIPALQQSDCNLKSKAESIVGILRLVIDAPAIQNNLVDAEPEPVAKKRKV